VFVSFVVLKFVFEESVFVHRARLGIYCIILKCMRDFQTQEALRLSYTHTRIRVILDLHLVTQPMTPKTRD
jgi:hypothetical protein